MTLIPIGFDAERLCPGPDGHARPEPDRLPRRDGLRPERPRPPTSWPARSCRSSGRRCRRLAWRWSGVTRAAGYGARRAPRRRGDRRRRRHARLADRKRGLGRPVPRRDRDQDEAARGDGDRPAVCRHLHWADEASRRAPEPSSSVIDRRRARRPHRRAAARSGSGGGARQGRRRLRPGGLRLAGRRGGLRAALPGGHRREARGTSRRLTSIRPLHRRTAGPRSGSRSCRTSVPGENTRDSASGAIWSYLRCRLATWGRSSRSAGRPTPLRPRSTQIARDRLVVVADEPGGPPWSLADGSVDLVATVDRAWSERVVERTRTWPPRSSGSSPPTGACFVRLGPGGSTAGSAQRHCRPV